MDMCTTRGGTARSASRGDGGGGRVAVGATWTATFWETACVGSDDDGGAVVLVGCVGEKGAGDEGCVWGEADCGLAEDGGVDVEEVVRGRGGGGGRRPTFENGLVARAVRRRHPGGVVSG